MHVSCACHLKVFDPCLAVTLHRRNTFCVHRWPFYLSVSNPKQGEGVCRVRETGRNRCPCEHMTQFPSMRLSQECENTYYSNINIQQWTNKSLPLIISVLGLENIPANEFLRHHADLHPWPLVLQWFWGKSMNRKQKGEYVKPFSEVVHQSKKWRRTIQLTRLTPLTSLLYPWGFGFIAALRFEDTFQTAPGFTLDEGPKGRPGRWPLANPSKLGMLIAQPGKRRCFSKTLSIIIQEPTKAAKHIWRSKKPKKTSLLLSMEDIGSCRLWAGAMCTQLRLTKTLKREWKIFWALKTFGDIDIDVSWSETNLPKSWQNKQVQLLVWLLASWAIVFASGVQNHQVGASRSSQRLMERLLGKEVKWDPQRPAAIALSLKTKDFSSIYIYIYVRYLPNTSNTCSYSASITVITSTAAGEHWCIIP